MAIKEKTKSKMDTVETPPGDEVVQGMVASTKASKAPAPSSAPPEEAMPAKAPAQRAAKPRATEPRAKPPAKAMSTKPPSKAVPPTKKQKCELTATDPSEMKETALDALGGSGSSSSGPPIPDRMWNMDDIGGFGDALGNLMRPGLDEIDAFDSDDQDA